MGDKLLTEKFSWEEIVDKVTKQLKSRYGNFPENKFRKWYMKRESAGRPFDANLIYRAFKVDKLRLSKNRDQTTTFCGYEGEGKSTMAIQWSSLIDPKFNVEKTCFYKKEFFEALRDVEPKSSILLDEGGTMLFSREAMKTENIQMNKIFMIIRAKRLNLSICIPNFYTLDSYIREHRTNMLIHINKVGHYKAILPRGIRYINRFGPKNKDINSYKLSMETFWTGNFNKSIPTNYDWDAYEKKKNDYITRSLNEIINKKDEHPDLVRVSVVRRKIGWKQPDKFMNMLRRKNIPIKKIGRLWHMSYESYENLIKTGV